MLWESLEALGNLWATSGKLVGFQAWEAWEAWKEGSVFLNFLTFLNFSKISGSIWLQKVLVFQILHSMSCHSIASMHLECYVGDESAGRSVEIRRALLQTHISDPGHPAAAIFGTGGISGTE